MPLRKEIRQARPASEVPRYGGMYGPDVTFLGVEGCDLDDPAQLKGADVVIAGALLEGRL